MRRIGVYVNDKEEEFLKRVAGNRMSLSEALKSTIILRSQHMPTLEVVVKDGYVLIYPVDARPTRSKKRGREERDSVVVAGRRLVNLTSRTIVIFDADAPSEAAEEDVKRAVYDRKGWLVEKVVANIPPSGTVATVKLSTGDCDHLLTASICQAELSIDGIPDHREDTLYIVPYEVFLAAERDDVAIPDPDSAVRYGNEVLGYKRLLVKKPH